MSREEIMEILEAFDLTGSLRDAGELAGCSHHTMAACIARCDAGRPPIDGPVRRESGSLRTTACIPARGDRLAGAGCDRYRPISDLRRGPPSGSRSGDGVGPGPRGGDG